MSIAKIALTAGLLALQAALLALLHSGEARSVTVHQCNGQYQQTACTGNGLQRTLEVVDARHAEQVRQAHQQLRLAQQQVNGSRRESSSRTRRAPGRASTSQAVGLTAHRSGDAPFRNGQQVGVGSVLHDQACVQIGGGRVRQGTGAHRTCKRLSRR